MSESAFELHIGDWSGDGHAKSTKFSFSSNKPIEAVREAYFAAKVRIPDLCPDGFCSAYEDNEVPDSTWEALDAHGCPLPSQRDDFDPEAMALVVAWFCMQGDSELQIRHVSSSRVPMLHFYGADDKGRHIRGHGYGLFS